MNKEKAIENINKRISERQKKNLPLINYFDEDFFEVLDIIFKDTVTNINNEKELYKVKGQQEVVDFLKSQYKKINGE